MNDKFQTVSIIVVNYNGLNYLRDCFTSLIDIDYPKELLEYILVDNGSTDGSRRYMEKTFPEVQIIRNTYNKGYAGANNQAARVAKGEILAFLNNDMRVHPMWLAKLVGKFSESSEDLACVSSKILSYDGAKIDFIQGGFTPFGISFQVDFGNIFNEATDESHMYEKELLFACGGAMAIKRKVFLDCGGFDEQFFAYLEDVDLGWRLRIMGYRILYVPDSIVFHRHGGTGRRIPVHQLEFMLERNRLITIIKNTEDAYLPYFLCMAFMFNMNRTFLASLSNPREFQFFPAGEGGSFPEVRGSGRAATSIGRKLLTLSKKKDFGILWRWFIRKANDLTRYAGYQLVPRRALSCSAAFDSLIPKLSTLILKRREIQSNRKISDREILPLFLMDQYPKQAIAQDSVSIIEQIMNFGKEIMNENRIHLPD